MIEHQKVLILDFGSQYTQLIARRIREHHVYCEIVRYDIDVDELRLQNPVGLVLSGGPDSVYEDEAPRSAPEVFDLGVPVLAICYGMQLAADQLGGVLGAGEGREYGRASIDISRPGLLFAGLPAEQTVWMSHGDHVLEPPKGFDVCGSTASVPVVAMEDAARRLFAIQFHPEVSHTEHGSKILANFLSACEARGDWRISSYLEESIESIREQVGDGEVLCALSGGVDSSVMTALLKRAVGDRAHAIFVDNGVLRKGEREQVLVSLRDDLGVDVLAIDAVERFLGELQGVEDPEAKRKVIGRVFIEVFEEEAKKLECVRFLAQGTLYPDVIESVPVGGPSSLIKSHHNVGGLPETLGLDLVEPLRYLFKDEVRELGRELGLKDELIERHPFPGPGLAVRILGEVTAEKVSLLQEADAIFIDELRESGYYSRVSQAFAVLLPVRSVGVMGDYRTYENVVALRSVDTTDFMTADWSQLPYDLLGRAASRIVNDVKGINRVTYDITSKPPGTIEWE
jgi:GMP synthase (glutamine-hydrolysing)